MEKQELEMKRKLEMESRNGNWKWKLEAETGNKNGNKRRTNHWCNIFFIVCFVITRVFYLAIFMGLAL